MKLRSSIVVLACVGTYTCGHAQPRSQVETYEAASRNPATVEPQPRQDESPLVHRLPDPPPPAIEDGLLGLKMYFHDPSGQAMLKLHHRLRQTEAGERKTRLLFFGASHIASDAITGRIRERMQARFGDAGAGFLLPVKPWRYYRHSRIDIDSDWKQWKALRIRANSTDEDLFGLAGVAVETDEAGHFGTLRARHGELPTQYELFLQSRPEGGKLEILVDNQVIRRISTEGESVANAYVSFDTPKETESVTIRSRGDGPIRIYGISAENPNPGVVIDTLGINGSRARYHLLWHAETYLEHVMRRDPALIALAYGTNESGDDDVPLEVYERRLREVLGRLQDVAPQASCLLIGASDRPQRDRRGNVVADRPRTSEVNAIQKKVSEAMGCAWFDLQEFMGGPMSMATWVHHDPPYGSKDHIHFTHLGYQRLGDVLHDALLWGYDVPQPVDTSDMDPPADPDPASLTPPASEALREPPPLQPSHDPEP